MWREGEDRDHVILQSSASKLIRSMYERDSRAPPRGGHINIKHLDVTATSSAEPVIHRGITKSSLDYFCILADNINHVSN